MTAYTNHVDYVSSKTTVWYTYKTYLKTALAHLNSPPIKFDDSEKYRIVRYNRIRYATEVYEYINQHTDDVMAEASAVPNSSVASSLIRFFKVVVDKVDALANDVATSAYNRFHSKEEELINKAFFSTISKTLVLLDKYIPGYKLYSAGVVEKVGRKRTPVNTEYEEQEDDSQDEDYEDEDEYTENEDEEDNFAPEESLWLLVDQDLPRTKEYARIRKENARLMNIWSEKDEDESEYESEYESDEESDDESEYRDSSLYDPESDDESEYESDDDSDYESDDDSETRSSRNVDYTGMDTIEPESEYDGITDIWAEQSNASDSDYEPSESEYESDDESEYESDDESDYESEWGTKEEEVGDDWVIARKLEDEFDAEAEDDEDGDEDDEEEEEEDNDSSSDYVYESDEDDTYDWEDFEDSWDC